jgi:hypothetical protein
MKNQINHPQCSIIDDEYMISNSVCALVDNMTSIDKNFILAYIIDEHNSKKRVFDVWKKKYYKKTNTII